MKKIFHWFYCLDISEAILWLILATLLCLLLRTKYGKAKGWKPVISALLLSWGAMILYATLGHRSERADGVQPQLIPFYSYYLVWKCGNPEIYRSNFMNGVLFYPIGLLGCELLPKSWGTGKRILLTVSVAVFLSIAVEYLQYHFSLGVAETGDVIHNALGAIAGAVVCCVPTEHYKRS